MNAALISVLLVEDDAKSAALIQASLTDAEEGGFRVELATRLADALGRLGRVAFDVVLLDVALPDGRGIEAFDQVLSAAPNSIILALSASADEALARKAVLNGAHDYVVKDHVDRHWLPRALRYAVERKADHEALQTSEARFRAISDASPLGIFVSDADGECVYTNAAYQVISGLSFEQTLGTNWSSAVHPEDRERVLADWREAARRHAEFHAEVRFVRSDGSIVWARLNASAMGEAGSGLGHIQVVEDISERKAAEMVLQQAERALFEEKERAQVTLNSIGDAVLTTNIDGQVTYMNQVAEAMTGWPLDEAIGHPLTDVFNIVHSDTRLTAPNPADRAIEENRTVELAMDSVLLRRDGTESEIEDSSAPIHDRDGKAIGAVIVFHDVSQSRAMAQKMSHLAQHDFLTGLPNRVLLTERLSQAISHARRHRKQAALLFVDLDYFKHINDSLGHAVGDQLLRSVAYRLGECVRATDTVCRQGGDEFVILLSEIEQPKDAALIAEKLLAAFSAPHVIEDHELHVTLSIGVSIYPDDGATVDLVMQCADTAMYHAKASGRNNFQFFRAEMNTLAVQRLAVETSLRRALRQGEFVLYYQPKIDIATGAMTGAEALIRWQDPEHGLTDPEQFMVVAEECGLSIPIGQWVIHTVCRQVQTWLETGLNVVPISINVSAMEFRNKKFLEGVIQIIRETALAPRYLELEITESVLMHDAESAVAVLESLRAMGVRLAIDDFGTGYSSLSFLKQFPIDALKIDKSFVRDITTDPNDATIVGAMIGLGRNLKLRVVAEGVETHRQLAFLRAHLCDEGQGFLFSHPLAVTDFAHLLIAEEGELDDVAPSGRSMALFV